MATDGPQSYWRIEFYTTASGKSPVLEYIDALPADERAQVRNHLRLLQEYGTQLAMPYVRQVHRRLWELRPGPNRLLYFADTGAVLVLLHAFRKQTNKTPRQDIETALKRMELYHP